MSLPNTQRALVANDAGQLELSNNAPMPPLLDDAILVRTAAVALNPVDNKTQGPLSTPRAIAGTDFAGTVIAIGPHVSTPYPISIGDRICGAVQGMHSLTPAVGAFSEYIGATGHVTLKIPPHMSFEEAATLGSGLATVGAALFRSLQVPGHPDAPLPPDQQQNQPREILIYGGSTAVGTLAIQLAKLSGLTVLTTCSPKHFAMLQLYGADHVFDYHDGDACTAAIKAHTRSKLRFALDCVSEPDTLKFCYACLGRTGGRYTALEPFVEGLAKARPSVKADWILGPTALGKPIAWRGLEREADDGAKEFAVGWFKTAQRLLDGGKLRVHPVRRLEGGMGGILDGLEMLRRREVSGEKLVCTFQQT